MVQLEVSLFARMALKSHTYSSLMIDEHDYCAVLEVLDKYEKALRQQINQDKTQIFFSSNTTRPI